jgi:hypothetical protein
LASREEGVEKMKIILNESQLVKNFSVFHYAGNAGFEEVYKILIMYVLSSQIKCPED